MKIYEKKYEKYEKIWKKYEKNMKNMKIYEKYEQKNMQRHVMKRVLLERRLNLEPDLNRGTDLLMRSENGQHSWRGVC